jgi:chemotaxis protein MotB
MAKNKHGHHGGAWKVAYADFVTAMMALFLVLWLASQDEKIKEAVERSFRNPFASLTKESTGLIPNKDAQSAVASKGNFDSASAVELNMLRKISQDLLKAFQQQDEHDESFKLEMLPDGMRVNVFDRGHRPVFGSADGSSAPSRGKYPVIPSISWWSWKVTPKPGTRCGTRTTPIGNSAQTGRTRCAACLRTMA